MYFADLNLPQAFEVHFSNKQRGESKTQIGSNKLVEIPDEYFWSGALEIYAWVYLHSGTDDGETIYEVKIPLIKRAKPTDEEPLPVQQSAIDKAIAELNNAVDITNENADKTNADKTQVASIKEEVVILKEDIDSTARAVSQDAQSARESADASEQSAQNSAESKRKALDYSDEAKGYAQSALESKNTASQKAQVANDASAEAKDFRDEAETFKNEAEQAKQNIVDYRNETKGYRDETLTVKNDVQTIKGDVQSLKTQIDKTATDVATNASDAKSSADSSYRSAISADNASLSASQFADEASDFADSASQSASQAEEFKNQSATNVTHYPKVVDGYWYVWDASNAEYVNTNVDARGIKGDKGDIGKTGDSGVYIGTDEPTDEDIDVWIDSDGTADDIVTDVKVNGQSIVQNGVANVPIGDVNNYGVLRLSNVSGMELIQNRLRIVGADIGLIKNPSAFAGSNFRPIVPIHQHTATFYGLAKASGDTTQSQSSNAVGNYTEEAKAKIQKMLGVSEEFELINVVSIDADAGRIVCKVDMSGQQFSLKAAAVIIYSEPGSEQTDNAKIKVGFSPVYDLFSANWEQLSIPAGIRIIPQTNFGWAKVEGIIPEVRNGTSGYTTMLTCGTFDMSEVKRFANETNNANANGYIQTVYVEGKTFGAGSFIRVWGIRA